MKSWTAQGIPLTEIYVRWRDESLKICLNQCLVYRFIFPALLITILLPCIDEC